MSRVHSRTRWMQIGLIVLLLVCTAQVGWWIVDQRIHANQLADRAMQKLENDLHAAQTMVKHGIPASEVAGAFESIIQTGGEFAIDPDVITRLQTSAHHRLRRYAWEGSFFLIVLVVGMAVLARALHQESILRRRQQNFLAAVGHEFKSPLAGARLAGETLLLRDPPPDGRRRLIAQILNELERLEDMIANLLDTARIEEGSDLLQVEPVEVAGAIRNAVDALQPRAESSGVEIRTELEGGLVIQADQKALATVLRNLLDNACKATANCDGGEIRIRAHSTAKGVTIEVQDDGEGFPPEEGRKLFEKFYRPGDEMRRGGRGSGLGLYIVRHLVQRSGGQIHAFSEGKEKGAKFTLLWPRMKDNPQSMAAGEAV